MGWTNKRMDVLLRGEHREGKDAAVPTNFFFKKKIYVFIWKIQVSTPTTKKKFFKIFLYITKKILNSSF